MLNYHDENVRKQMFDGNFGLEKESLRILENGHFAHTKHPCENHTNIVRDFCENQTEINTPVYKTAKEALNSLYEIECHLQKELSMRSPKEYLWPFSNPPFIESEEDIPQAIFDGENSSKSRYRKYLADKYGKYKMTLCGIHINFSFGDALLEAAFKASGESDFTDFKNKLYLHTAKLSAKYGWLLTALFAASPVVDSSYLEKGNYGHSSFLGLSSIRCSELGYWNYFTPVFDYSSLDAYMNSIHSYEESKQISHPSELYYPIRLKPKGAYQLENFKKGISHIELRMVDLNPIAKEGLDLRDVQFAQLFLFYLACRDDEEFSQAEQVQAVANFKNAAHYDLKTVRYQTDDGHSVSLHAGAMDLLLDMMEFYAKFYLDPDIKEIIYFQYGKIKDLQNRYSIIMKQMEKKGFVKSGIQEAKARQKKALEDIETVEISS